MANALESRNSSRFGLLHSSVIVTSSGNPWIMVEILDQNILPAGKDWDSQ